MINIQSQKAEREFFHYLSKTIQNYNLNINDNSVFSWDDLYSIWRGGIIKLPPLLNHWGGDYYLPVADVKNPFETWVDNHYCGVSTPDFEEWMKQWEEIGEFEIIKTYSSFEEFENNWYVDQSSYNFTSELLQNHSPEEIFKLKGINQSALAMDLIEKQKD